MSSTSAATTAAQMVSITSALLASGAIASMSLFDIPELQAQPASRSLPAIRWLFSRGSHIMPQAASVSSAAFAYLAYDALPQSHRTLAALTNLETYGGKTGGYLAAALLAIGIAPFTAIVMIPTNFAIIKMNADKGGARSQESARQSTSRPGERSALDSVRGQDEVNEFTDLSGPQTKADNETTQEEDEKARELLRKFGLLNWCRAVLVGAGGMVGLWTALQ